MIAFGPQAAAAASTSRRRREWLVTDGLGGYAMGTVAGLRTRRYHGLLVGRRRRAVRPDARPRRARPGARRRRRAVPPRDRRVGRRDRRPARARAPRLVRARPRRAALALAGRRHRPRARARDGARACRRRSRAPAAPRPTGRSRLELTPLCTWRSVHGERFAAGGSGGRADRRRLRLRGRLPRAGAGWTPGGDWYRGVRAREEAARGLNDLEDMWAAGTFAARSSRGRRYEVTAAAAPFGGAASGCEAIVRAARERAESLVANGRRRGRRRRQLVLAADQFVIRRRRPDGGRRLPVVRRVVARPDDVVRGAVPLHRPRSTRGASCSAAPRRPSPRACSRTPPTRHARVQHRRRHALVRPRARPPRRRDG